MAFQGVRGQARIAVVLTTVRSQNEVTFIVEGWPRPKKEELFLEQ
jgi:hypothetical protein